MFKKISILLLMAVVGLSMAVPTLAFEMPEFDMPEIPEFDWPDLTIPEPDQPPEKPLLPTQPTESPEEIVYPEIEKGQGMVSINFDDGLISSYIMAAPLMQEYDMVGTAYVYTQAQNEEYDVGFMQWEEVVSLQNDFDWEIGAHGFSHDNLTEISWLSAKREIRSSKEHLALHGIRAESFATPYGAFNDKIVNYIARYYNSHRTAWNLPNSWPINDYYLKAKSILPTTPVEDVKAWINQAKMNNEWLILIFHALTIGEPQIESDDYNIDDFIDILEHLDATNIPVVTNSQALSYWGQGDNLIPNGSFELGSADNADNWIKSQTIGVQIKSTNRGVYPEPKRSAYLKGGNQSRSLSTLGIEIDGNKDYRLKAFYRVTDYIAGDASIWISEFDENYGYVGGQWLGGFNYNFIGTRYFDYTPSVGTKKIELFFLTHEGANMELEIDGVEMKEL